MCALVLANLYFWFYGSMIQNEREHAAGGFQIRRIGVGQVLRNAKMLGIGAVQRDYEDRFFLLISSVA